MIRPNRTYIGINLVYFVVVLAMVLQALTFKGEGAVVPLFIGIPTLAMIVMALTRRWLVTRQGRERAAGESFTPNPADVASWARGLVIAAWVIGLFLLVFFLGFNISIPVYTLAFLRAEGKVSWVRCAVAAIIIWAVIYTSFDLLMGQTLFGGILFHALLPSL